MRRGVFVVVSVLVALSVTLAAPANAATVAVVSEHTTAADFQSGDTSEVTISGSGESAQVTAKQVNGLDVLYIDNGQLNYYNPDTGTTGTHNLQHTPIDRPGSGLADYDGDGVRELLYTDDNQVYHEDANGQSDAIVASTVPLGGLGDFNNDGFVGVAYHDIGSDELRRVSDAELGSNFVVNGVSDVGGAGEFDGDGKDEIAYSDGSEEIGFVDADGEVNKIGVFGGELGGVGDFNGDGEIEVVFDNSGSTKIVDNSGNAELVSNSLSVAEFGVGSGDVDDDGRDEFVYRDSDGDIKYGDVNNGAEETVAGGYPLPAGIGDWDGNGGFVSGTYTSATHDATDAESAFVDLSIPAGTVDVEWQYYDGSNWVSGPTASYSAGGVKDVQLPDVDSEKWRVKATLNPANGQTPKINSEGVRAPTESPDAVLNTDQGATGEIETRTVDLAADVSDSDFADAEGDSVTVQFQERQAGSTVWNDVGAVTVSQNGTATTEATFSEGGTYEWRVVATDAYGNSVSTGVETVSTPGTLFIRDELNTTQFVKNANATVRFYSDGDVYTRDAPNGKVNFTGLPVTETFVVTVNADGYYNRRAVVMSLYEQQSIYLLPDSNETVAVTNAFVLDDKTGRFSPSSTYLFIQKPITDPDTGNTSYKTIVGGTFGATNEFPATLEKGGRYRMIVENADGDRRVLGGYVAEANGTRQLGVGQVSIERPPGNEYVVDVTKETNTTDASVTVRYLDSADSTEEIRFILHETGNRSNVADEYESFGTGNVTVELLAGDKPAKLTLTVEGSRVIDGETREISQKYPIRGGATALDVPFTRWIAILGIVSVAFVASLATPRFVAPILVTAVVFAGLLMYLRVVQLNPAFWWVAATIAGTAVYKSRR